MSAPSSVAPGAPLTLRVQLRAAAPRPAKLRVLLSVDKRRSASDVQAGTVRVARRGKLARAQLLVPGTVKPGRYYLLVCGKNCAAARLSVVAKPGAPTPTPTPAPRAWRRHRYAAADPLRPQRPRAHPQPGGGDDDGGPAPDPDPLPSGGLPAGFDDSVSFLYEGPNRIQTGVAPGTIKPAASPCCAAASTTRRRRLGGVASPCSATPSSATR